MPISPPTISEARGDLAATNRDIRCLTMITGSLRTFIEKPHGEDRSRFKRELFLFEGLLEQGKKLRPIIEAKIKQLQS